MSSFDRRVVECRSITLDSTRVDCQYLKSKEPLEDIVVMLRRPILKKGNKYVVCD